MAGTKQMRLRRKYVYADGSTGSSAKADAQALHMECLGTPKDVDGKRVYPVVHTVEVTQAEFPSEIIAAAAWHGLSQKLGDANAAAAKIAKEEGIADDPEKALADLTQTTILEMIEDLKKGFWVSESESGGGGVSVTVLLEAIEATFAEAGTPLSEEQKVVIAGKLKDEEYRTAAKARPDVAYHMKRIQAERAAARAKAAKAAVKGAEIGALSDLI